MISPAPPIPSSRPFSINNSLHSHCAFLTYTSSSKCTFLPEDIQLQAFKDKSAHFFHSQIGDHSMTTCLLSYTSCFYPFSLCHGQLLHLIHQRRIHACRRFSIPKTQTQEWEVVWGGSSGFFFFFFLQLSVGRAGLARVFFRAPCPSKGGLGILFLSLRLSTASELFSAASFRRARTGWLSRAHAEGVAADSHICLQRR